MKHSYVGTYYQTIIAVNQSPRCVTTEQKLRYPGSRRYQG